MNRWVDVRETDWFFNEVMEASQYILEDGKPLVEGIPYTEFENGAPYLYEEHQGENGKTVFVLNTYVVPTSDNPLYAYIDGIQTIFKEWRINGSGKTEVEFYTAPPAGSLVSFVSLGKPLVDRFGKPSGWASVSYPQIQLNHPYFYDPFNRRFQEYVYAFGRKLRRVNPTQELLNWHSPDEIASILIGYNQDVYWITDSGKVYLPYNLHNVTVKIQYLSIDGNNNVSLKTETRQAVAPTGRVAYNNRFFPNALITRAEAFSLIERLRKSFYQRFTDIDPPSSKIDETHYSYDGQKVFKLKSRFPLGGHLRVYREDSVLTLNVHYIEFDDHTILMKDPLPAGTEIRFLYYKDKSSRFADVGVASAVYIDSEDRTIEYPSSSWWKDHVLSIEEEKVTIEEILPSGEIQRSEEYLIAGVEVTNYEIDQNGKITVVVDSWMNPRQGVQDPVLVFMPNMLLTRAQAVTFLDRFLLWCIEKFKK